MSVLKINPKIKHQIPNLVPRSQIGNLNWSPDFFYLFKLSYDSITACFRVLIAYAIQSISNFKKLGRAFTIVVLEG